jgi:hypothetical protein
MDSGNTDVKPNQRWILDQTNQAVAQEEKRWFSDSLPPTHKTQPAPSPPTKIRRRSKFSRVGSLPRSACQEKTISFFSIEYYLACRYFWILKATDSLVFFLVIFLSFN